MSVSRIINAVSRHKLGFLCQPSRLLNRNVVRTFSIYTLDNNRRVEWNLNDALPQGHLLGCSGCLVQSVRYGAWFTKSKLGPRIPPTKHLDFDHSGDRVKELPELDLTKPRIGYENSEELKTADETIKKIYSLEFATMTERHMAHRDELVSLVNKHRGDYTSLPARIARLTVSIRTQIGYCLAKRKDKVAKLRLNNNIQIRTKYLKRLRASDHRKFLQVCEVLNLDYIPYRWHDELPPKSVRGKRLLEANEQSAAIMKEKMDALEKDMAVEKEKFYREKDKIMSDIERDLQRMGIDGQAMMNAILEEERKIERWQNTKFYRFLQRFPAVQKKYVTMRVQE